MTDISTFRQNVTALTGINERAFFYYQTLFERAGDWSRSGMDIVLAASILLLAVPIIGATALAIKCCDRGPIFSHSKRFVRDGRLIDVVRFRTTILQPINVGSRMCWDLQLNVVGRLLGGSRVASLPQLINVLRGEMTLIGTRLERPDFLRCL